MTLYGTARSLSDGFAYGLSYSYHMSGENLVKFLLGTLDGACFLFFLFGVFLMRLSQDSDPIPSWRRLYENRFDRVLGFTLAGGLG